MNTKQLMSSVLILSVFVSANINAGKTYKSPSAQTIAQRNAQRVQQQQAGGGCIGGSCGVRQPAAAQTEPEKKPTLEELQAQLQEKIDAMKKLQEQIAEAIKQQQD